MTAEYGIKQAHSDAAQDDASGMLLMWQSVVLKAVTDAYGIGTGDTHAPHIARRQADIWLRGNSPDFRMVCALAGMDPDFIREAYVSGRINVDAITPTSRWGNREAAE